MCVVPKLKTSLNSHKEETKTIQFQQPWFLAKRWQQTNTWARGLTGQWVLFKKRAEENRIERSLFCHPELSAAQPPQHTQSENIPWRKRYCNMVWHFQNKDEDLWVLTLWHIQYFRIYVGIFTTWTEQDEFWCYCQLHTTMVNLKQQMYNSREKNIFSAVQNLWD